MSSWVLLVVATALAAVALILAVAALALALILHREVRKLRGRSRTLGRLLESSGRQQIEEAAREFQEEDATNG